MERHLQDNVAESGLAQVVGRDVQRDGDAAVEGRRGVQERQQGHQRHSRRGEKTLNKQLHNFNKKPKDVTLLQFASLEREILLPL